METHESVDRFEVLPSRRKRLWLLLPLIGLMILVVITTKFMSGIFLVYTAVLLWATINLFIRVFNSKLVLVLTPQGLMSGMTSNGKKAGLVPWINITEIKDIKTFGFIKAIEIYTAGSGNKFLLHLASDEAAINHEQLLEVLLRYWNQYKIH